MVGRPAGDRGAGLSRAADAEQDGYRRLLLLTGVAYAVMHHVGSLPGGLGTVGPTRWADWIDLAGPYLVLVPATATMVAARAGRATWLVFLVGAIAYAQGHGIHLSANSIGNVAPGDAAHLWDEVVGHLVWYTGAALVTAALAVTMAGRPRPAGRQGLFGQQGLIGSAVALAVGLTWATNAIGGGTELLSAAVAAGLTVFGWLHRDRLAVLLPVGYLPATLVLLVHSVL